MSRTTPLNIDRWPACRFERASYRLWIVAVFAVSLALVRWANATFWNEGRMPETGFERLIQWAGLAWCATVPAVLVSMVAVALPRERNVTLAPGPDDPEVAWRIVSRGRNAAALAVTVDAVRRAMAEVPLFRYRIEVVTDEAVALPPSPDLHCLVVPGEYRTPNDSKWKARALCYALDTSTIRPTDYVVHLDEETWPSPSCVHGIALFIARHGRRYRPPIGQGMILYYRHLSGDRRMPKVLTLADMLRTGDDICRFRFQYRLGVAPMGMHGSYIVVRNDVERSIGLDVGPDGSVTEDAWFAMAAQQAGCEFAWVDGYMVEQAPETVMDLVKQRRRWWSGLFRVALYSPCPAWVRVTMLSFLTLWGAAVIGAMYTVTNLFLGLHTNAAIDWIGSICFAWYLTMYLLGLRVNLAGYESDLGVRVRPLQRAGLYTAQLVLVPVFGIVEGVAVLMGICRPERGFTVITKSATAAPATAQQQRAAA